MLPRCVCVSTGNPVRLQHQHHHQDYYEYVHVHAAAHDQDLGEGPVSIGGVVKSGLMSHQYIFNSK